MYCRLSYVSRGGLPLKTLVLYIYRPKDTIQQNQQSYSHSIPLTICTMHRIHSPLVGPGTAPSSIGDGLASRACLLPIQESYTTCCFFVVKLDFFSQKNLSDAFHSSLSNLPLSFPSNHGVVERARQDLTRHVAGPTRTVSGRHVCQSFIWRSTAG
jgi:hypothetical protein